MNLFRILIFLTFLQVLAAAQSNWPQLRRPGGMGVSDDAGLPTEWGVDQHVNWQVGVPGMGWSSPVVWSNQIFLTTAISDGEIEQIKLGLYFGGNRPKPDDVHEWRVRCFDLHSGDLQWEKTVHRGKPSHARHLKNSYASETPIVDGERIYAYIGNVGLFAFSVDGEPLWERKWPAVKTRYGWGQPRRRICTKIVCT